MDCVPELDGVVKSLYGAGDDHHRGLDFTVERMQVDVAFCCRKQNKMKLTDISNVLHIEKLHCSVYHGLPNGHIVAEALRSVERQRTPYVEGPATV